MASAASFRPNASGLKVTRTSHQAPGPRDRPAHAPSVTKLLPPPASAGASGPAVPEPALEIRKVAVALAPTSTRPNEWWTSETVSCGTFPGGNGPGPGPGSSTIATTR